MTVSAPPATAPANSDGKSENNNNTPTDNLPATTNNTTTVAAKGVFDKAVDWVKEHPGQSLLVAGGAAAALYWLFSPKPQGGLSGVESPRKKKKRKKQPEILPNISGLKKPPSKTKKKGKTKKHKL